MKDFEILLAETKNLPVVCGINKGKIVLVINNDIKIILADAKEALLFINGFRIGYELNKCI